MTDLMAEWDAGSRLEEIKRAQRKAGKGRMTLGAVLLVIGLASSVYMIGFSGAFSGPLGLILGFAFLVVAVVGVAMIVTGYFDLKAGKIVPGDQDISAATADGAPPSGTEAPPASLLGKEMKWLKGELKDTWTLQLEGKEIGRIGGKGTYPFSFSVKGQFDGTPFQMAIVKKPDKHFEVRTGPDEKEWAKIWNASITHLSPAVVKTQDGRVFEIRDAGKKENGLSFVVVGKGERMVAETTYHEPRGNEMGTFLASGLESDKEILIFALVCVIFAALLGPLESAGK